MQLKRISLLILLLAAITAGSFGGGQLVSGETAVATAVVHNLTLNDNSVAFTLQTPPVQYEARQAVIAGLTDRIETPGAPALPIYTAFIALPPTGEATVTVRATAVSQLRLPDQPLAPVPESHLRQSLIDMASDDAQAIVSRDPDDLFELTFTPDSAIYQADAFYPAVRHTLSAPMMRRDVRLAQLTLYPVQYNPVTGLLLQADQLEVVVTFSGVTPQVNRPSPSRQDNHINDMRDLVVNFDQIEGWRSLPANFAGEPTRLPIGQETYKIEINQDGVYEISYEMLAAAGMDVASVDPHTFEMLHRGETVAYQFVGDPDNGFQPGEAVRFYGWASLGSRIEDQYVANNVFWLWANGAATPMESREPETGHPLAESFLESVTHEEDRYLNLTFTNLWPTFPNEPDVWYWLRFTKPNVNPITQTLYLTLPHPALTGPDAAFTVEVLSRANPVVSGIPHPHIMTTRMNQHPNAGSETWFGGRSVNITSAIPPTHVVHGLNRFDMVMETNAAVPTANRIEMNRITVDYWRQFIAVDNALAFSDHDGGGRLYAVSGFTQPDPQQIVVWDISQPYLPEQIAISAANISGSGPYTYTFGSEHGPGARFIAAAQFHQPVAITEYTPVEIDPPGGAADWIAISYAGFITETQRLADHRADPLFGGLATHIVAYEDVVNQYGYGLAVPAAVQNYLRYALAQWQTAPSYLLLVGDGSDNPAGVNCQTCASWWDNNEPDFITTNLVFEDRWQGRVPSDEPFVFLVGDDILADMAIGRLPAQTNIELAGMIDKTILYETNHLSPDNYDWLNNILFVNDRSDTSAGNFCLYSQQIGDNYFPDSFAKEYLCLPNAPTSAQHTALRLEMIDAVMAGASFLNYRGHGSTNRWGSTILSTLTEHQGLWQNADKPVVIFSLDCLDGWFSLPGSPGLGETYHGLSGGGTAAHWSSSGLGLTYEHTLLHQHLNRAIFEEGLTSIGSAIQYAKMRYHLAGGHRSMIYSFVLLGDPAMQLMRPDLHLDQQILTPGPIDPGDEVTFRLELSNEGLYPALPTLVSALPVGLTYMSAESTLPITVLTDTTTISMSLAFGATFPDKGLPYGETAVVTLTLKISPAASGPMTLATTAHTPGVPITPGANQTETMFIVFSPTTLLTEFSSRTLPAGVELSWTTAAELYTEGFQLWRSDEDGGTFTFLADIGLVPSQGSGAVGADYTAVDATALETQTYWYELREIKLDADVRALTPRLHYLATSPLLSFSATGVAGGSALAWATASELEAAGFMIERSLSPAGTYEPLPAIGMIPAEGGAAFGAEYEAVDETAVPDTPYWYRLIELKQDADERIMGQPAPLYFPTALLTAFTGQTVANGVQLSWTTAAEFYADGFQLWRSADDGLTFTYLTGIGLVSSQGSGAAGADYTAVDATALESQTYWYELREIKLDGEARVLTPRLHYLATSQLASFTATSATGGPQLAWVMSNELATQGFLVQRSLSQAGPYTLLPEIGMIPAAGAGNAYLAVDSTAVDNTVYWYKLVEVKLDQDQRLMALPAQLTFPTVTLAAFTAQSATGGVQLEWTTTPEFGSQGFWVERSVNGGSTFTRLTAIGLVPAVGGSAAGASYIALDSSALRGQTYAYRLVEQKAVGFPAQRVLSPVISHLFDPPTWNLYLPLVTNQ